MTKPDKRTAGYWNKRFTQLEEAQHNYGLSVYRDIEPAFTAAERKIKKEIEAWYGRFADNNSVSLKEAKRLLNGNELDELKWDVKEYIKYGRENAIDGAWMKELENASAKFHISRLEGLMIRIQQAAEKAFGSELDAVDKMCREVYTRNYYHSLFELQRGTGIGFDIASIDQKKLDKLVARPWTADGRNFSDRIWSSKKQLIDSVHKSLVRTCAMGQAPDAAIKELSNRMNVSRAQAGRLIMTEQAYFSSVSTKESYKAMGLEKYEICATLDSKTSEICQDMDGEVFDLKDYEPGSTAPPFHPNCRTTTVPWFDDFQEDEQRAARNEEDNTYYTVPADMTYKEWAKKSVVETDGVREEALRTKRSSKSEYGVKWDVVKSKDYNNRFQAISDNEKANNLALKHARNMLRNRDGKASEELYAISLTTGKDISAITNQNYDFGVVRTKEFSNRIEQALSRNEKILYIHNHPRGTAPSIADLNELVGEPDSIGIIIGHDGSIYLYSAPDQKITDSDIRIANKKILEYNYEYSYELVVEVLSKNMGFRFRGL